MADYFRFGFVFYLSSRIMFLMPLEIMLVMLQTKMNILLYTISVFREMLVWRKILME